MRRAARCHQPPLFLLLLLQVGPSRSAQRSYPAVHPGMAQLKTDEDSSVVDIASTRQIIVDLYAFEQTSGASIQLGHPQTSVEPVFTLSAPWEAGFRMGDYSSAMRVAPNRTLLWYNIQGNDTSMNGLEFNALAESEDGLHFTRPNLGQVHFRGSSNNNIIADLSGSPDGKLHTGREGNSVSLDPTRSLGGQYISLAKMENGSDYLMFSTSDDGVRWRDVATWDGGDKGADNQPSLVWDPEKPGWILYTKEWMRVPGPGVKPGTPHVGGDYRQVRRLRAPSLAPACKRVSEKFSVGSICWGNSSTALGVDDCDRFSHRSTLNPSPSVAPPAYDFNSGQVWRHPSGVFLMLAQRYAHWEADRVGGNKQCHKYKQHSGYICAPSMMDVALAVSRDGDRFGWPAGRECLLCPSSEGSFASRIVGTVQGVTERDDETWVYYYGDNVDSSGRVDPAAKQRETAIGLARFRLDGFAFLNVPLLQPATATSTGREQPWPNGGCHIISKPFRFSGSRLVLNVDTGAIGSLAVALEPVSNASTRAEHSGHTKTFTLAQSVPLTTNSVRAVASWWPAGAATAGEQPTADVSALSGTTIRLHFLAISTRLYSYQFLKSDDETTGSVGAKANNHSSRPSTPRPNLLFMMADQMRYDRLGVVSPGVLTPALDNLAKEGALFSRAYSSTPTCTPARAAILTGQKPWNHGMLGFGDVAHSYPFEMPSALTAIGYSTTVIGKDHFGWNSSAKSTMDLGDKGSGIKHGYEKLSIYDGADEPVRRGPDDYDQWFERLSPARLPNVPTYPLQDDNSWTGRAYPYAESFHPTAWVGRQAVSFIKRQVNTTSSNRSETRRPWMLKVSFHRPHSPYDPPARLLHSSPESSLPPVAISLDGWDRMFRDSNGCGNRSHVMVMSSLPNGALRRDTAKAIDAWCGEMSKQDTTTAREAYYANIRFVDEWVGEILSALEQTQQKERTYIIWTADHGDGQADHHFWRKGYPFEFSSHIPFLLRWPEIAASEIAVPRGTEITDLVELRDILPTMLDAAGGLHTIPAGHTIDGASVLCLLRHRTPDAICPASGWRTILDLEHDVCYNQSVHWNALLTHDDATMGRGVLKYIFHASPGGVFPTEQLFNLSSDPAERTDLAKTVGEATLTRWRRRLVAQWEEEGRGSRWYDPATLRPLPRGSSQLHSPNFPSAPPHPPPPSPPPAVECAAVRVGAVFFLHTPKGACDQFAQAAAAPSEAPRQLALLTSSNGSSKGAKFCVESPSGNSKLVLAACSANSTHSRQEFTLAVTGGRYRGNVRNCDGLCLTAISEVEASMMPCGGSAGQGQQAWVLGTKGRLCVGDGDPGAERCLAA